MTLTPSSLGATTLNYVGKSQYSDPYLVGRIDDFRIYARALTATEVGSLKATSPIGLLATTTAPTATVSTGQAVVAWTTVSGATAYDVLRATVSGGPYTAVATSVTTTSYLNTGLTSGTTYYYVVMAYGTTGESVNSSEVTATAP